jgi:Zn-dependent M28 family amino/carboxypeptidase
VTARRGSTQKIRRTGLASLSTAFYTYLMELIESRLRETVYHLSGEIGERSHLDPVKLGLAAEFIEKKFASFGCIAEKQAFAYRKKPYHNIWTEVKGTGAQADGILVIGAHYDSAVGTPGADDNASGVAGMLELARLTAGNPLNRTVRFVAFSLEEPPAFMTRFMGSYAYAKGLSDAGIKVYGMISLEMLGYFCSNEGCQLYPSSLFSLFYPGRGDFISFVGNLSSRAFTRSVEKAFREVSSFPIESLSAPAFVPGVDFSDHRNFWKFGYPAFMITDTAFYRNPNYHSPGDTAETLDYKKTAEIITGLYKALKTI